MAVITAGLFLINNDNKLLIAHPTGHDFWSIPKGKLEGDEEPLEAAIRETWEETNFEAGQQNNVYELEPVRYKSGRKVLHPTVIFECENRRIPSFKDQELKCNSMVDKDAKWNAGLPEMDDWKWVELEEAKGLLHDTQVACIDIIQELITEMNGEK